MLPPAFWKGKSATLPFWMTNTLHLKRSQYQIMVLSFLPLWTYSCVGWWIILHSSHWKMFIFSRIHCVCKQKQMYFFPFGARITDVLVVCVLYFPQMQQTEELWLYMYTWGLHLVVMMVGDISQFTICVVRHLISHVRFYPLFTLLLGVTLPLLFFRIGKKYVYKILKTSPE